MSTTKPLIQSNIDLRSFEFMPLDVVRFRDSDFTALVNAEAFRAGFMLMCASWHQVPAGSLPSDDRILSNLAGFGRVVKEWKKYKDEALHGWVLCDDGRYYHPVVCEKALESWSSKQEYNFKKFTDRLRKANLKLNEQDQVAIPSFEAWIDAGMPESWANSPQSNELESKNKSAVIPMESESHSKIIPKENALKGTEHNGQYRDNKINNTNTNTGEQKNSLDDDLNLWNPSLDEINTWRKRAGLLETTQEEFNHTMVTFMPHYAPQIRIGTLKQNQVFSKYIAWVKRDYKPLASTPKAKPQPQTNNRNVNQAWGDIPEHAPADPDVAARLAASLAEEDYL